MKPQTTNPTSPTIGIKEAAEIIRCGYTEVQKLIATGELPALRLTQRHTVLLRNDVLEFVRLSARRQASERKAEHDRRQAQASAAPVMAPSRLGRKRRPLPDLSKYERLLP